MMEGGRSDDEATDFAAQGDGMPDDEDDEDDLTS